MNLNYQLNGVLNLLFELLNNTNLERDVHPYIYTNLSYGQGEGI